MKAIPFGFDPVGLDSRIYVLRASAESLSRGVPLLTHGRLVMPDARLMIKGVDQSSSNRHRLEVAVTRKGNECVYD
jgi:hypothetical protein